MQKLIAYAAVAAVFVALSGTVDAKPGKVSNAVQEKQQLANSDNCRPPPGHSQARSRACPPNHPPQAKGIPPFCGVPPCS